MVMTMHSSKLSSSSQICVSCVLQNTGTGRKKKCCKYSSGVVVREEWFQFMPLHPWASSPSAPVHSAASLQKGQKWRKFHER
jgi:hypothetical protein